MVGDPGSSEQCKIDGNRLRHFWTRGCAAYRAFSAATGQASPYRERRHQALLAYLALHPSTTLSRDRLVGLFWPGSTEESGRANLRQALSSIRKALGPEAGELIVASRDRVAIRRDGLATDLQSLQSAATAPHDAAHPLPSENIFLEGLAGFSPEFDTWRAAEQARVSDLLRECLANRVEPALAERRFGDAAMLLARALEIEPLDEAANRGLMRLHLAQDDRAKPYASSTDCGLCWRSSLARARSRKRWTSPRRSGRGAAPRRRLPAVRSPERTKCTTSLG